jgi:Zinc finger, C3HC4 type (RING finger)
MLLEMVGRWDDDDMERGSSQVVQMDSPTYPVSDSEIAADLRALETTLLGFYVAFGSFVSDFYNRVGPAKLRWVKTQLWRGDPDIPRQLEYTKERCLSLIEGDVFVDNPRPQGYLAEQLERVRFAFKDNYAGPRKLQASRFDDECAEMMAPSASNKRSVGHLREPTASTLCVICLARNREILFDCGHFACCSDCGDDLEKCPVCGDGVFGPKMSLSCEAPDNPDDLNKCPLGHMVDGMIDPCGHIGYCHQCDAQLHAWEREEEPPELDDQIEIMRIVHEIEEYQSKCRVCQRKIRGHYKVLWA